MISTKDYCALGVLDILGRNYRPHGLSSILDPRVGRIYSFYPGHKDEAKVYLLTKSVARRVEKMDTDSLTPDAVLSISRAHVNDVGAILDPSGEKEKISSNFLILPDLILIDVFKGEFSRRDLEIRPDGKTDYSRYNAHFVGSIVVSPSGVDLTPNSALSLLVLTNQFNKEGVARAFESKDYLDELISLRGALNKIPKANEL